MAIIDSRLRSASAQAASKCRLLIIQKRDFRGLLLSDAKLCYNLLRGVSLRLRVADEEIENLLFRNILGRVTKTLYDLCKSCGRKFKNGILLKEHFTHQELADLVGTTREPLSRALAILRRAELMERHNGHIFIRQPQKLEAILRTSVHSD